MDARQQCGEKNRLWREGRKQEKKRSGKINVIPLDDVSAKPANKEKSSDNQETGSMGKFPHPSPEFTNSERI